MRQPDKYLPPSVGPSAARAARLAAGVTATQLAKRLRVTSTYLRACERDGCPSFSMAERLAKELACDMLLFLPQRASGRGRAGKRIPGQRSAQTRARDKRETRRPTKRPAPVAADAGHPPARNTNLSRTQTQIQRQKDQ